MAKGAMGNLARYQHNDMNDLKKVISKIPKETPKLMTAGLATPETADAKWQEHAGAATE